ncbi:MAG: transketolase C-terminal domain-containing protein [Sneathiellaceae bacterium]
MTESAILDKTAAAPAAPAPLMRDAFIDVLTEAAGDAPDILFVSADFGAKALDRYRRERASQFIHAGISEQNMVDLAAGLALSGKRVFLYAMAPFLTLRCLEQIKATVAAMQLPVTLVGVGVGLGYDHATLTHFAIEDLACLKAMNGIEILTPADAPTAEAAARLCLQAPAFRYIRLDRQAQPGLAPPLSAPGDLKPGLRVVGAGQTVAIVTCGALCQTALAAAAELAADGAAPRVIDLYRVKPLATDNLLQALDGCGAIVTVEEQLLDGGFGSAVAEALIDAGRLLPMRRLGLRDGFVVRNGHRDRLWQDFGIDRPAIVAAVRDLRQAAL